MGQLGCIDSIWSKIFEATDPQLSAKIKKVVRGRANQGAKEETIRKHALSYIDMLKSFEESTGLDSKALWDTWIEQVALQIQTPGRYMGDYSLVDQEGDIILSGDVPYNYGKPTTTTGKKSTTSPYYDTTETGYDPEKIRLSDPGLFDDEDEEEDKKRRDKLAGDISRQHSPGELGYVKEQIIKRVREILRSKQNEKTTQGMAQTPKRN